MWYIMEKTQMVLDLSDRLIRSISSWHSYGVYEDSESIEELIDLGADVNRLHGTVLPLHCACMVSDVDSLLILIRNGANINLQDGYGRRAIHYAAEKNSECVEILLNHGSNINAGDGNQDTALHWAVFKNNEPCVKLLLEKGAIVDARDYNEDTPLSWAARKGNIEVMRLLLDYNASVNLSNAKGETPISRTLHLQTIGLNTTVDDACLELLFMAAGRIEYKHQNIKHTNSNETLKCIVKYSTNVRSLRDLSIHAVRSFLGYQYLPSTVEKLPIPRQIQKYILLQK
ncbi:ankyrin repeat and SOCS box protein 8-like [Saccostrea echinata]|uniref:ankyrin repeat and SOCS box protein 8-like n=1 Tax=Saccostrea echinata TaxID=191078 RepID=UPI002A809B19|nr:ankyrin repeat and SOCS box protein 8-like [Saccostrea echinata]XP_061186620.1 ankyrin repeat and SOCS box protein 8-like [Saccostrea echinata]